MLRKNYTEVTEFILLELTDLTDLQPVLFCGLPTHLPDHSHQQYEHDFVNQK